MSPEVSNSVLRQLAKFEVASATESRLKLIEEHGAAFRWLVASLFAVNGAGILALISNEGIDPSSVRAALFLFFLGLVAAFGTAFVAQQSDRKMISQIHRWGLHWAVVEVTCALDPTGEAEIKEGIAAAEATGRKARLIGWLSMVAFFSGAIVAAVTIK